MRWPALPVAPRRKIFTTAPRVLSHRCSRYMVAQGRAAQGRGAGMSAHVHNVRFTPKSGHVRRNSSCLLWAKSGHDARTVLIYLNRADLTPLRSARTE